MSCAVPRPQVGAALGPLFILPAMFFGGFFLNNAQVPVYLQWLRYYSWLMFTNEALTINQWDGVQFPNTTIDFVTGQDVIEKYGFDTVLRFPLNLVQL